MRSERHKEDSEIPVLFPNHIILLFFILYIYIRYRQYEKCFTVKKNPTSLDPCESFNFWQVLMK